MTKGLPFTTAQMSPARLGGLLVCAGSAMTLVLGLVNPISRATRATDVILPSLCALGLGLICVFWADRAPRWVLCVLPAVVTVLVCLSMWRTNSPLDGSELLFVWCIFFAGYFLPPLQAVGNTILASAAYAFVVIGRRGLHFGLPPAIYLTTTLVVACFLVSLLRRRAAASLDEARTEARTDPLTGLLNRRGFGEVTVSEVARAERDGRPLSAWMLDLDHFKGLNDALGHAAGDRALRSVAGVLRGELRGVDIIGRIGGEEFAVLLPNCTTADAFLRAEAVRVAIAEEFAQHELPVTVSIGVAAWRPGDVEGGLLLSAADEALYAAKAAGRNQSHVSRGLRPGRLTKTDPR